ncbi:MAG TPA: hypothetical protein VFG21_09155 [Xanthomonadaceae bacterium]|nr:hypothetical protein [Xanthomonadaceae bacterium]
MTRSAPISPLLVALDAVGAVLLLAGFSGVVGQAPWLGVLGAPAMAWTLTGLGAAVMVLALGAIVATVLRHRDQG